MTTFNYPKLETTTFNGLRWYITPNGDAYPSITSILGGTQSEEKKASLKNWQQSLGVDKAAKVTKDSADNGTVVHLFIERYLKKEDVFAPVPGYTVTQQQKDLFNSLKLKLNGINEVWANEESLYSDILEVAGRVDCIGLYKGVPSIIDFKTSRKLKNDKDIEDYKFQLAGYAIMHNELFGTDITNGVILMAAAEGFPLEFKIDLLPFFDKLYDRVQLFYSNLNSQLKIA